MTKKLKWRLSRLPEAQEVSQLVNDKIITKEESREILFSEVDEKDAETKDLKSEIEFLRKLVEKLSNKSQIIQTIRTIEKPYYQWGWYQPYQVWCNSGTALVSGTVNSLNVSNGTSGTSALNYQTPIAGLVGSQSLSDNVSFSEVKTF